MIAQLPNLDTILNRLEIPPKFWPEMHRLVEDGRRPGRELLTRLWRVTNYKAARLFPPGRATGFQIILVGEVAGQCGVGITPRTKVVGLAANLFGPTAGLMCVEREIRVRLVGAGSCGRIGDGHRKSPPIGIGWKAP